jgi:prevent-host-death family protein
MKLFNPEDVVKVTELRNRLANCLDRANKEPVAVQRNGVITHVLISLEEYRKLVEARKVEK